MSPSRHTHWPSHDRPGLVRWLAWVLIPLLFLHVFLFLKLPFSIFLEGEPSSAAMLPDILRVLLLLAAASLLVQGALLLSLGWPLRRFLGPLLAALALSFWLVDSFLGRDYPALDGALTALPGDALHGLAQLLVFLAVTLALWWGRRQLHTPALGFLLALTVLNSFWLAKSVGQIQRPEFQTSVSPEEFFSLSRQQNVLLIVMDTFQSEYFTEALAAEPRLADKLQGFHYYPDTVGVATSTFMSLPAIHSGKVYEPGRTMLRYFEESIGQESVLTALSGAGFASLLLNPIRAICPAQARCLDRDNLLRSELQSHLGKALHLLDVSLMRSVPEPLKNAVLNEGRFLLGPLFSPGELSGDALLVWDDSRILGAFSRRLRVDDGAPRAVMLHLMNTHPPYVLDSACQAVTTDDHNRNHRDSAIQQVICALRQFGEMMQGLKDAEIFDQTMVVVAGDHGSSSAYADASLQSRRLRSGDSAPPDAARVVGSANPILLIKPVASAGPWQADSRPADLTDIPATTCAAVKACDWPYGVNLLSSNPIAARPRQFMSYRWEHDFWQLGYIPELDFYAVNGPLDDWSSWSREQAVVRKPWFTLTFTEQDDDSQFGPGWGELETSPQGNGIRWVVGTRASLHLPLPATPTSLIGARLMLGIWVPDFNPGQALQVSVNGQTIRQSSLPPGVHQLFYQLPMAMLAADSLDVQLDFTEAARPNEEDLRELAVVVNAIELQTLEAATD